MNEASEIIPDMITTLAARFIILPLYEWRVTSTFHGLRAGSHLIVCADEVHSTSLEHCEYSLVGAEF